MVKMWEKGHSFEQIRAMDLEDFGLVLGYWHEDGRVQAKQNRIRKQNQGRKKRK